MAGLKVPMTLGGKKVTDMVVSSPNTPAIHISIAAFTYCGTLRLTMYCDRGIKMDCRILMKTIEDDLDESILKYGMV